MSNNKIDLDWIKVVKERTIKSYEITYKIKNEILDLLTMLEEKEENELKKDIFKEKALIIINFLIKQEENLTEVNDILERNISMFKTFYDKINKDSLTWLFNKEYIENVIEVLLNNQKNFYLIFIDMDNLKQINDTYWHNIGDQYLKYIARILNLYFGDDKNIKARIHGDEFVIISMLSLEEIYKILSILENKNFSLNWNRIPIKFSYWIVSSNKFKDAKDILNEADKEMYKMKKRKKRSKH